MKTHTFKSVIRHLKVISRATIFYRSDRSLDLPARRPAPYGWSQTGLESERITRYPKRARQGEYVLYWMQQAQRSSDNPALDLAVEVGNRRGLPVATVFALTDSFPEANLRHYSFMLEGLAETSRALRRRGIAFALRIGDPPAIVLEAARHACALVMDTGYLRIQRQWRRDVAENAPCEVFQVEGDVSVPVATVSDHQEYAARTIRPKLGRLLNSYLNQPPAVEPTFPADGSLLVGEDLSHIASILSQLDLDGSVEPVAAFTGGTGEAEKHLRRFIDSGLERYGGDRNSPADNVCSNLSPYLHFGQISSSAVARRVRSADVSSTASDAFLEELIVRRELAVNYVFYCHDYDAYAGVPKWARETLAEHARDARPVLYSREKLERGETDDDYWNAAQIEMVVTGKMHNYMRMYWGKRLLEWTETPEEAFDTALYLNNKYELDGRDPNGFTGVAWCFGLHDRAWPERPVFGKVRCMKPSGLKRKFDMQAYLDRIRRLTRSASPGSTPGLAIPGD